MTPASFWKRVKVGPADACWLWLGAIHRHGNATGYGRIRENGHETSPHRRSWEMANGPIPEGLKVLHSCDNPTCVNPKHLSVGTQKDNMEDAAKKGRIFVARGSTNARAKLTDRDVARVRELLASGMSQDTTASLFGVHQRTISRVHLGRAYVGQGIA